VRAEAVSEPQLQLASPAGAQKSNLAYALGCLPPARRHDALVFYDFCRAVDDIADDPGRPPEKKRELLELWKTCLTRGENLPEALWAVLVRHDLDRRLLVEIVRGVGLVSIQIFGCKNPASKTYAELLGYALQLTNILRDVAEDAALGRIYLPVEDLQKFEVSESSLLAGKPSGNFSALMRFETARARSLFAAARHAFPAEDAYALKPAELMRAIYERILSRMEADNFRVFERRYRLSRVEKLAAFLYFRFWPLSFATSNRVGII
jgi:15-cis-phytoene synthase